MNGTAMEQVEQLRRERDQWRALAIFAFLLMAGLTVVYKLVAMGEL